MGIEPHYQKGDIEIQCQPFSMNQHFQALLPLVIVGYSILAYIEYILHERLVVEQ